MADVAAAAPGSRLNLLLTDGRRCVGHRALGHSLSVRTGRRAACWSLRTARRRPGWIAVPDGHLVVATADHVLDITPLTGPT